LCGVPNCEKADRPKPRVIAQTASGLFSSSQNSIYAFLPKCVHSESQLRVFSVARERLAK